MLLLKKIKGHVKFKGQFQCFFFSHRGRGARFGALHEITFDKRYHKQYIL